MLTRLFSFVLFLAIIFNFVSPGNCLQQWNINLPQATDSKSNWPAEVQAQWNVQDNLLSNFRQGLYLTYSSASAITMGVGQVTVSTGGAQPRLFLTNTTTSSLTTANLDTGASFASSTTYYIYAGATSSTASLATGYISLSNTAPAGVTYYSQLGNFTTDSNGNIATITDNSVVVHFGTRVSKSVGTIYQATTDGTISLSFESGSATSSIQILSDANPSPSAVCAFYYDNSGSDFVVPVSCQVIKGQYYQIVQSGGSIHNGPSWLPLGQ